MKRAPSSRVVMRPAELEAYLRRGVLAAEARQRRSAPAPAPRRRRRGRPNLAAVVVVPILALLAVSTVFGVHDENLFQLDANALVSDPGSPATVGDDWDEITDGPTDPDGDDGAITSVFVTDPISQTVDDIFTTGGSKDDLDIRAGGVPGATIGPWQHTTGSVPDKDNITHAYAAAYNNADDELILYFGLDRLANNGDAQVGFWFFQSGHAKLADGTFSNAHDEGDILILSDFTNGGTVSTIRVFEWVGTGGDTNGTLDNIFNGVACALTTGPDVACAQANTEDEVAPWSYDPKFGPAGTFPQGSFFEGGVNLTELGLDIGCGSSFMAETRSSQSVDAQLKDFAQGDFALCGLDVQKTGDTLSKVGDPANYSITITNTGSVPLFRDSIIDDVLGDIEDGVGLDSTISNYVSNCGASLAPGASCTITLTYTVQAGDPDPLVNTVTATYNSDAALTGSDVADTDDHSTNLFQPGVVITKTGDTLSKIGDQVTYTFEIDNTSSTDSPNLVLDSISDDKLGDLSAAAIAAGCDVLTSSPSETCSFTVNHTIPAGASDPYNNLVTVHYHPSGFPNDITDTDTHSVGLFQPGVVITKTGDTLSKIGDQVTYTFEIDNTSSTDSPNLILDSISDTKLGNLLAAATTAGCDVLTSSPSETCSFTVNHTIPAGAADPYPNTVTVHYHPSGFPNDISDSDDHSVNLFQPGVTVDKTGDTLSKVGDPVNYTITVTNTSSDDSPNLVNGTIVDTLLGNLLDPANPFVTASTCTATLATTAGVDSCTISATRTVQAGDPDPLPNTVTVHYNPSGFPNDITDSDDHSVGLFQPGVTVDKTGDTLSKIGDPVTYTITVTNTSSTDSPNLVNGTIVDSLLGDLLDPANPLVTASTCTATLATTAGVDSCQITAVRTVQAGDADPLPNTVTVHYNPSGFPNDITDSDDHSVNLFQPGVTIDKTGDTLSKVGDPITYTYTITNTSSSDSPNLILDSIVDTGDNNNGAGLGSLAAQATAAGCNVLTFGEVCIFTVGYTILGGDDDPLDNTVTVHYHPSGFPNDITDSDSHSVDLFGPSLTIDKTGDTTSKVGDSVTYTYTITNTSGAGSPNLILDSIVDTGDNNNGAGLGSLVAQATAAGCDVLTLGETCTFTVSYTVLAGDDDPLDNTVTVHYHPLGFPNDITDSDDHSVDLFQPGVTIVKDGPPLSKIGDQVTYTFTITNDTSADGPDLILDTIVDNRLGDIEAAATLAGCDVLDPAEVCQFTVDHTVPAGAGDPYDNEVVVHYHPLGFPNDISDSDSHSLNLFQPGVDVEKVCEDFSKATDVLDCTITVTNTSSSDTPDLTNGTIVDTLTGNLLDAANSNVASSTCTATLATGASCTIATTLTVTTSHPDPLINTVTVHYNPTGFPNDITDNDSETIDIVHPAFTITKQCLTETVPQGGSAIFEIVVTNTGDIALNFVLDEEASWLDIIGDAFPGAPANLVVGGGTTSFTLPAGAYQHFDVTIVAGDGPLVENAVNATVTLPASFGLDNVLTGSATDSCDVEQGGATRTPGFWQTHVSYTTHVFEVHLGGTIDLGWKTIDDPSEIFGMFWANNARESDGSRRDKTCQAQVIGSFHLLAAILNTGLSNGAPVPTDSVTGLSLIDAMRNALAAGDRREILRLVGLLDAYNNGSDDIAIIDDDGFLVGNADPRLARQLADLAFADCN